MLIIGDSMANQNSVTESREKVEQFLVELKSILSSPNFNPAKDLDILLKKKNEDMFDSYTTANTCIVWCASRHSTPTTSARQPSPRYLSRLR